MRRREERWRGGARANGEGKRGGRARRVGRRKRHGRAEGGGGAREAAGKRDDEGGAQAGWQWDGRGPLHMAGEERTGRDARTARGRREEQRLRRERETPCLPRCDRVNRAPPTLARSRRAYSLGRPFPTGAGPAVRSVLGPLCADPATTPPSSSAPFHSLRILCSRTPRTAAAPPLPPLCVLHPTCPPNPARPPPAYACREIQAALRTSLSIICHTLIQGAPAGSCPLFYNAGGGLFIQWTREREASRCAACC